MSQPNDLKSFTTKLRSSWIVLVRGAFFIGAAVLAFVKPLDVFNPVSGVTQVKALSLFVAAILTGMFFFFDSRWSGKRAATKWATSTLVCLLLSIVAFFGFQRLADLRLCEYAGANHVLGTELTPQGLRYISANPGASCTQVLMDFVGRSEDVWTQASISESRLWLSIFYLTCFWLASACMLSLLQLVKCVSLPTKR